jgi:HemY protein
LEQGFGLADASPDTAWLSRIEAAQLANPRDAVLQYLAGMVCMRLNLWGKAQQLLKQSLMTLNHSELTRDTWLALAHMAELRQDDQGAADAYREAAKR